VAVVVSPDESAEAPVPALVGGRYRLLRRIGSGGMGVVWLAHDEVLQRRVAVKELQLSWGSSDRTVSTGRERSLREARAAAALHHPNIVAVYDIVDHDDRPWIVMEFVSGSSLKEIVAENGPLSTKRAVDVGLQLLAALHAAHAAGITHRDVKPANVLISDDGVVRLTDFGLATTQDAETLTATGAVLGTPGYLAPEQAKGLVPGPPADMFGLGATLYYAIEGVGPFHRDGYLPTLVAYARHEIRAPQKAGVLAPVLVRLLTADPETRPTVKQAGQLLLGEPVRSSVPFWRRVLAGSDVWRQGAFAFQILGAMLLLAIGVRRPLAGLVVAVIRPEVVAVGLLGVTDVIRLVGWALVVATALLRHRRLAAGLAVLAAAVEVWRVAGWYQQSPSEVLRSSWIVTAAVAVAAAAAWLAGVERTARPRSMWWFGGALAVALGASICDLAQGEIATWDLGVNMDGHARLRVAAPLYLIAAGLAGWAWWREGGPIRRRLLAFATPVAGMAVMVTYGFASFMESSQSFPIPVRLIPTQWVILVATPVLAFVVAALYLNRWERLRLMDLGHQAGRYGHGSIGRTRRRPGR
jgi:hypothetical protein